MVLISVGMPCFGSLLWTSCISASRTKIAFRVDAYLTCQVTHLNLQLVSDLAAHSVSPNETSTAASMHASKPFAESKRAVPPRQTCHHHETSRAVRNQPNCRGSVVPTLAYSTSHRQLISPRNLSSCTVLVATLSRTKNANNETLPGLASRWQPPRVMPA